MTNLAVLGSVLVAGLVAVTSPCIPTSSGPVAEGTSCSLAAAPRGAGRPPAGTPTRPAVVEVTSHHCPACRTMEPVVAEAEHGCEARVVRAFIEDAEGAALLVSHGIEGLPTFLVLDARGAEVDRLVGMQSVGTVRRALGRVSTRPCR